MESRAESCTNVPGTRRPGATLGRLVGREADREARASRRFAERFDGATRALNCALRDRKAKAGAVDLAPPRAAIETVERVIELVDRHPRAFVRHLDDHVIRAPRDLHADR